MTAFILGSIPLISLNKTCLEMAATSLMMLRDQTPNLSEIDAFNKEINTIISLVDQCDSVLKTLEKL
jgi:hypothetical protein